MYRIMVIEDEPGICQSILEMAAAWDMQGQGITDFRRVMTEFAAFQPHMVVMDITLPFMNGYHWCREIRKVSQVPILFLSSAADRMNMIMAMNMGADDFIAKPFDQEVLAAKLMALLRRSYDYTPGMPVLEHRGALLNTGDGSVIYHGEPIHLTKNEYRILLTLMNSKGKIVSREKLMEALWQTDAFVDDNTLTVNVNRLRKKLAAAGLENFVETRFGAGYILSMEDT